METAVVFGVTGWIHGRALGFDRALGPDHELAALESSSRVAVGADSIDVGALLVPHELVQAQDARLGGNVSGGVGEQGEVEHSLPGVASTCVARSEFEKQVFEY